jgi:hypothetical protein
MWVIILIVVLVVLVLSRTSFEVRHEIVVNAPAQKVWQAIIDLKQYKQWNSQLAYLGGQIELGATIHLKLSVDGATPYEFRPIISQWQEGKSFAWLAITGVPKLFDGEHFFEIAPLDSQKTRLVNRETYSGVISLLMKQLPMMKLAPAGFEKMNLEFKAFIEA